VKRKPVLNVSLDRGWTEEDHSESGTHRRDWFQERDERLKRACQNPEGESRFDYWCQENHKGKRCDTLLGEVYATSEGDLWEARVSGADPYILEWRKMFPQGAETSKVADEIHAHYQWLDEETDNLFARCRRHGAAPLNRGAVVAALANGKRHAQRRGGRVSFG
jgi:hypothetical protein